MLYAVEKCQILQLHDAGWARLNNEAIDNISIKSTANMEITEKISQAGSEILISKSYDFIFPGRKVLNSSSA
jgi:hypothetical protein